MFGGKQIWTESIIKIKKLYACGKEMKKWTIPIENFCKISPAGKLIDDHSYINSKFIEEDLRQTYIRKYIFFVFNQINTLYFVKRCKIHSSQINEYKK